MLCDIDSISLDRTIKTAIETAKLLYLTNLKYVLGSRDVN